MMFSDLISRASPWIHQWGYSDSPEGFDFKNLLGTTRHDRGRILSNHLEL
jgi:hypothetical protein